MEISNELRSVVRPAVHHCMKNALGVRELLEASRFVFVELAAQELEAAGEKATVSRLSVMTGLQRPVIKHILDNPPPKDATRFTVRVVGAWRNDKRFLGKNGQPKVLGYEGDDNEFAALVHSVSTDLHPATVLFDLERLGLAEKTKHGVKLKSKAFITRRDVKQGYRMLARDTEDLAMAILGNLEWGKGELPNYHGMTSFDNVSEEDLKAIRDWIFKRFSRFHREVEKYLAKQDLDLHPNKKKKGGKRVMVGLFSRTT